jgi:hypothetical protein
MTVDTSAPRSRRAILAASLGGAAAFVANALSRATPANAADGQTMVVGGEYSASSKTFLGISADDYAFWGASDINIGVLGSSGSSIGVHGESTNGVGTDGWSQNGTGVKGESTPGWGVWGVSSNNNGVYGTSVVAAGVKGNAPIGVEGDGTSTGLWGHTASGIGARGDSDTGVGVWATAGPGAIGLSSQVGANKIDPPAIPKDVAIYARSIGGTATRGVIGETTGGRGINGVATSGRAVQGQATSGRGVYGYATGGTAGYFERQAGATGIALRAVGPVKLDNCSGLATINSSTSSVIVTPGIDLAATSAVVATLQGDAGGSTAVKRIAVNTTNNTFTIYLTANSTATVKVAWHVFV